MQVNKYPLYGIHGSILRIPMGAELLKVDIQATGFGDSLVFLWALVRPGAALENRTITIVPTGEAIPGEHIKYINSFGSPGYEVIFHAFEVLDEQKGKPVHESRS